MSIVWKNILSSTTKLKITKFKIVVLIKFQWKNKYYWGILSAQEKNYLYDIASCKCRPHSWKSKSLMFPSKFFINTYMYVQIALQKLHTSLYLSLFNIEAAMFNHWEDLSPRWVQTNRWNGNVCFNPLPHPTPSTGIDKPHYPAILSVSPCGNYRDANLVTG